VGCGLGHRRCLKSLWHRRTSLPLLCGAVGAGGGWVCSSSISCRQHLQLEGSCFGLQQENAASFPSAGRGEAKPGDRLLRRHHLRCFLIPCPGASSSRTCLSPGAGRGRDGRSAGEQPVLSGVEEAHGQAARAVGTLTCCCYHSPCDRLRNSKYFLSDKGDWGRPEISGRVWASLRSQTPGREVRVGTGSAGLQVPSGQGAGRCGNRASCLSLTFNPSPAWRGRTLPPVFPLPLVRDHRSHGTQSGLAVVPGLSRRGSWGRLPRGRPRRLLLRPGEGEGLASPPHPRGALVVLFPVCSAR